MRTRTGNVITQSGAGPDPFAAVSYPTMTIQEAFEALELRGHRIDRDNPIAPRHGKTFYKIDGVPRSEEQILAYVIHATPFET
jgi:hypothetical protein